MAARFALTARIARRACHAPAARLRATLDRLLLHARDLAHALQSRLAPALPPRLRRGFARNPDRLQARVDRAAFWLYALCRTLAGSDEFLRLPRPRPTSPPGAPPSGTPPSGAQPHAPRAALPRPPSAARERARIARAFHARPVAWLALRLAVTLGLDPGQDAWPAHALALLDTPARYQARRQPQPRPRRQPAPQPASQPASHPLHTRALKPRPTPQLLQ